MNYIVIDLEYNQPFDFIHGTKKDPDVNCPFEIVQIGAVKLDGDFNILSQGNFLIKPSIYPKIHPYVEKITGLTSESLAAAPTFPVAYKDFLDFASGDDVVFCIWGGSDMKELYRNIRYYCLDNEKLSKKYINIQPLAAGFLEKPTNMAIGLKSAVESLNIQLDLPYHDALNDALYTSAVFKAIGKQTLVFETLNPETLAPEPKNKNYAIDYGTLFSTAQKLYGRKLTPKEKNIIKKMYKLGRSKAFDL